ncbi:unnamed protein product [Prunus brigantina]
MTALKEQRCEREPPVDDDDFGGLPCPPLDDLEAVFILETMPCDPSNFFDDIKLDDDDFGGLPCPPLDDLESVFILETMICDLSNLFDDIKLDERDLAILEKPKKPSHGKGKDLEKIQVIDIKNLPLRSKPGRGLVLTKNKFLTSSRQCRAF